MEANVSKAAVVRDRNKAEAEKAAKSALAYAKRAYTLFAIAECPQFSRKAMDAAHLLSEVC